MNSSTINQHLGTIGKREEFIAKVAAVLSFSSRFGERVLVIFDADGKSVVWWTNWSSFPGEVEPGNPFQKNGVYRLRGTVRDHGEYRGKPQTMVSRVKPLETVELPPEIAILREIELLYHRLDAAINGEISLPVQLRTDEQIRDWLAEECQRYGA